MPQSQSQQIRYHGTKSSNRAVLQSNYYHYHKVCLLHRISIAKSLPLAALILRDIRIATLRSRNPTVIRNPHFRATSSWLFGLLKQAVVHASMTTVCFVTLYHAKKSLIEPILYQGRILKLYPRCHLEFMCYHAT